jgi:hypothetical protein
MGAWFIGSFCAGLCGEEMLLIKLAGTANSLSHLLDVRQAHFVYVSSGRTKGDLMLQAKFGIPCVPITHWTHLWPGQWVKPLVKTLHWTGQHSVRLFNQGLKVAKMQEFENNFFTLLEKVQATIYLFPEDYVIRDECRIARTIQRTLTAHP